MLVVVVGGGVYGRVCLSLDHMQTLSCSPLLINMPSAKLCAHTEKVVAHKLSPKQNKILFFFKQLHVMIPHFSAL